MMQTVLPIGAGLLVLAMLLCGWRLLRGPTLPDRVLALDTLSINALALLVLLGIWRNSTLYFEAALVLALFGFVASVALASFAARGSLVE